MGEHADDILNGDVDMYTGEWLGNGQGFPRTAGGDRREVERKRMEYCLQKLIDTPGVTEVKRNKTRIDFVFKGKNIQMFPYTGWHTGKGITDGRGIHNLLKQLK